MEKIDPIPSFWASVARKTTDGGVFFPEQRVTRVGKLADLVVLTKNTITVPEAEILTARVAMTILGGRVGYEAK